jgi:hypothetical protein
MDHRQQNIIRTYGREPSTLTEIGEAVLAVMQACTDNNIVGFAWRLDHSDCVSNSHSAPLSGQRNHMRKPEVRLGYPGWAGRVWIRYGRAPAQTWGSSAFDSTLTHTGCGGYGAYDGPWERVSNWYYRAGKSGELGQLRLPISEPKIYSYDYRLYDSDWPGLESGAEYQAKTLAILQGRRHSFATHEFRWVDPEQEALDAVFFNEVVQVMDVEGETA